ncbi:hypothetical protein Tco_1477805 [Tanacetum coccineum]
MNLYHSRLTHDYLNELIIKYKIPRDLHPRLPSEDFVMSELSNDAIGVYHHIFNFYGVRIPFFLILPSCPYQALQDRADGDVVSSLLDSLQTRGLVFLC